MNKTVIITGTSSGLGEALFNELRECGVRVVALSRRFLPEQERQAPNVSLVRCDLVDRVAVEKAARKTLDLLKGAKEVVFINNAFTIGPIGEIGELSGDDIAAAIQVNITSSMLLVNTLMTLQKEAKLSFINVSSGAAVAPIVGWAVYCSAKAGLRMFFSVLKKQSRDIAVHEFDPGVVDTPMQEKIRASQFPTVASFKKYKETGELRDPQTVAKELIEKFQI